MAGKFVRNVLQVSNIPWTIGHQQLALYFSQFGYVRHAMVVFDKQTGLHKGLGYVTFTKRDALESALEHQHTLEGKNLCLLRKIGEVDLSNDTLN